MYIGNDCILPNNLTADDLLNKHRSIPYNPLIANTLFRAGFIESWGRGIDKIMNACLEHGNPLPEYKISQYEIMVLFKSLNYEDNIDVGTNVGINVGTKITRRMKDVLSLINKNPHITSIEMSKLLNVTDRTIERDIEKLKKEGIIYRYGSNKGGSWLFAKEKKK